MLNPFMAKVELKFNPFHAGCRLKPMPGTGLEPVTRGFSVR
jgi:hypothetical protein